MGQLVKIIGNQLHIAKYKVAGPGYTLLVSEKRSANGWTYYDSNEDNFVRPWDPEVTYANESIVVHNDKKYRSILDDNVWEPGITGWILVNEVTWAKPRNKREAYPQGRIVSYNDKMWINMLENNTNEPGEKGWFESYKDIIVKWVPSTYKINQTVKHGNQTWVSTIDNNTTIPGIYGWKVI